MTSGGKNFNDFLRIDLPNFCGRRTCNLYNSPPKNYSPNFFQEAFILPVNGLDAPVRGVKCRMRSRRH